MIRIISALLLAISSALAFAQTAATAPVELAPDAPSRYVVTSGDTLWGIAAKFLKEPYRWPEVWRMNKEQIKNPHRIYPGQTIVLEVVDGKPRLRLETVKLEPKEYVEPQKKEIAAIPYEAIQPFLSQPLVFKTDTPTNFARIVETELHRSTVGAGDRIYATGVTRGQGRIWRIYRPGKPLKVEGSRTSYGYEGIYLGTARLEAEGNPATLQVLTSTMEIMVDDLLVPEAPPSIISYAPHLPDHALRGNILGIYRGVGSAGKTSVVSISLGQADGLEVGHVLALSSATREVSTRYADRKQNWNIPEERNGLIFVFQVFDRVAYALVMDTQNPVAAGDVVNTP